MNNNRYVEIFQAKSDLELENILENKESYNEDAISAAFLLLKERKGLTSNLETVASEIKAVKERKDLAEKKALEIEKKKSHLTDDPNAPELHSKRVIIMFSAIFSTIFGVVLLMYNMKQTNNQKGRILVLIFGIVYSILTIAIVNSLNLSTNLALVFNSLGAAILTEYFWDSYIGKEFKYRKRSWVKPAIISVLITIPLLLAIVFGE